MDHLPDTVMLLVEEGAGITLVTGAGLLEQRARDSAGRWVQEVADRAGVPLSRMLEAAFSGREETSDRDALVGGREHEIVVSPLPPRDGRAQALLMLRDVSRDRDRERAITAAKERADRLFEDAPQGVVLLSPEGEVVRANPAAGRLLGRDDLVGLPLAVLSYAEDDPTVSAHLEELLSGLATHPVAQWSVCRADGSEARVVLSSTLLAGQDGDDDVVLTNLVDISERYRHEQQLAHLADHDPLTGLANRRRFDSELARHVDECRRYGARGAVLMVDLDNFKQVNDTLGHATGDGLLTLVAEVIGGRLRRSDVVARIGGDEFAVLLPHADREDAEVVARSLVDEVRAKLGAHGDSRSAVTVSVGGALIESPDIGVADLLHVADSAMYAAKAGGRDQYVVLGADPVADSA
jgi:diguanylate cyclase (GGDEF)-like protein/PAS domain S-box-containing protein